MLSIFYLFRFPDSEPEPVPNPKNFEWISSTRVSTAKANYGAVTPYGDSKNPDNAHTDYSWRRAASATEKHIGGQPMKKTMSRAGIIPLPTTSATTKELDDFDAALGIVNVDESADVDFLTTDGNGGLTPVDSTSTSTTSKHARSAGSIMSNKKLMEPLNRPHTAGLASKHRFSQADEVGEQALFDNLDPNVTDKYFAANSKERFSNTCKFEFECADIVEIV